MRVKRHGAPEIAASRGRGGLLCCDAVNRSKFTLVGLGELLWDLLPNGPQPGGAPANFAYHASAWGEDGVVASCVGHDALGNDLLEWLKRMGLGTGFVAVDGTHPTGTVSVKVDARGAPDITIHEGVARDHIPLSPDLLNLARRADVVCFGTLAQRSADSRSTLRSFLDATRDACWRILDLILRQSFYTADTIVRSLERSTVLKLNDAEWPVLARLLGLAPDPREGLPALLQRFPLRVVALTRGAAGSLLLAEDRVSERPGLKVRVVDAVGAGDAFTAAVAVGLLRGWDLDDLHDRAQQIAAYACTQAGATPPMPRHLFATPPGAG